MPTSFARNLLQEVYSQQDPKSEEELLNDERVIKDTSFSLFRGTCPSKARIVTSLPSNLSLLQSSWSCDSEFQRSTVARN